MGVNFIDLKNQIGIFNNRKSVLIDHNFLQTLPENELKSGFAEVVKHALIADESLWNKITSVSFGNLSWEEIISSSIVVKNNIVLSDPLEKDERKKLNFGHTYGHAIESFYLKKGTPISHGEAVFAGILLETELSHLSMDQKIEIKNYILSNFSLPHPPKKINTSFLVNDKKNKDGKISFSLLNQIGKCSMIIYFHQMNYKISHPTNEVNCEIDLPYSKSISNRLLIIRKLCEKNLILKIFQILGYY